MILFLFACLLPVDMSGISNQKSSRKKETSPVVLHASIVYYFYLLVVNPEQS